MDVCDRSVAARGDGVVAGKVGARFAAVRCAAMPASVCLYGGRSYGASTFCMRS